jgi:CubicO group peptidase (beta-lactamase class C family)
MPINRRNFLIAGPTLPALTSCATDLSAYRGAPVTHLAAQLGICSASYALLKAGIARPATAISGCGDATATEPDAIFQAASLTKPVIAFGALRLALAGQLDLEAPVSKFLPLGYTHFQSVLARSPRDANDRVPASELSRIPVKALLNHTSGLPNWASSKLSLKFQPGERWAYSGEGYVLLQSVIEAATGMSLVAYFDQHVFGPLGMRDTSLIWKESFASRARSGMSDSGAVRQIRFLRPVAAASLYTTAGDYAQFLSALVTDKQLTSLTLAKPVLVDRELGLEWGYGWGIERAEGGPYLWQWGNNPGFRAFSMVSTSSQDGFVVLTNSDRGMPLAVPLAYAAMPTEHNAFRFAMVG